jgi:hypothetical protein
MGFEDTMIDQGAVQNLTNGLLCHFVCGLAPYFNFDVM